MSATELSSQIDSGKLCEAWFSRCHQRTRLWYCLDVKQLWWSGHHEYDARHDETIHDTSALFCIHLSMHLWCKNIMSFRKFRVTALFLGQTAQRDAKANFWFGNIVRKQWTLSGFLQHTIANTIYIWNNKTIQQLTVLHINKNAWMCDTFFKLVFAHKHNYRLNGEITAEAHTAYTTFHRLMAYFFF